MNGFIYFKEKGDSRVALISALYITSLLANLALGYRYIRLGTFTQSGGIFIFPLSFILSDVITEIYGSILAKKLVIYGIISQFIFSFYAFFVIHLPAPEFLQNKSIYFEVFNPYVYFSCASTISIWLGSQVNIKLLSKLSDSYYFDGGYFALRSFIASTVGELLVTVVSMFIANFNRIELNMLIYMICCCFIIKTIISFVAIIPLSVLVYKIKNKSSYDISLSFGNIKNPIKYIRKLLLSCGSAKRYRYNLEAICPHSKKAHLYNRGSIILPLRNLIFNHSLIENMEPLDASHIGYYYAIFGDHAVHEIFSSLDQEKPISFKYGTLKITSITRNGKLNIVDQEHNILLTKIPIDLYRNTILISKFSSSQAMYIGYLAGLSIKEKEKQNGKPLLKIVK